VSINRSIEIPSLRENMIGSSMHGRTLDTRRGFYLRPGEEPLEDRSDAIDQVNRVDDTCCAVQLDGER
jgi:hypothetical protein